VISGDVRATGKNEMYAPSILKLSGSKRPSDPNSVARLPCSRICWPNSCARDEICHGM
jgi:hypothetical protein